MPLEAPYVNASLPVEERVDDLVSRMNLDEKLAQIGSVWLTDLVRGDRFDADLVADQLPHGIGHVTRIGASTGLRPQASAKLMNEIQRVVVDRTRLGIPVMVHEEGVGGYCARDATQFPQAIGLASTWDEDLITEVADVIRRQMAAVGARHTLSPVLDVARDARWGRVEETYGEDPYLSGRIGTAYVRGLQTSDLRNGVICTGKHFLGYAMSEGGMNTAPVQLGPRELREVYAEPFAAAIRDADLASVMNSYASVDGAPCAGSPSILNDLLRGELGFAGVVVADYFAVIQLMSHHRVAGTPGEAGAKALCAGLDIELPGRDCYGDPLRPLIDDGRLSMEVVDTAVRRVLRSKFLVGLFENPYVDEGSGRGRIRYSHGSGARTTSGHGVTDLLLKTAATFCHSLPMRFDRSPSSDRLPTIPASCRATITTPLTSKSCISGRMPSETMNLRRRHRGESSSCPPTEARSEPGRTSSITSHPSQHSKKRCRVDQSAYARGCDIEGADTSDIDEAVRIADDADVALVFVGGRSGLVPACTVGEAATRAIST